MIQYQEANRDAIDIKVELELPGVRLRENVWAAQGGLVEQVEQIAVPAVIGNY